MKIAITLISAALGVLLVLALGCSSALVPQGAPLQARISAACEDAKRAVDLGEAALQVAADEDQAVYWQRWIDGARKGLAAGCR